MKSLKRFALSTIVLLLLAQWTRAANEIRYHGTPGSTPKANVKSGGTRWNGTAFVAPSTISDGSWTTGMVTLTELATSSSTATGEFVGSIPAGVLTALGSTLTVLDIDIYETTPTPSTLRDGAMSLVADSTGMVLPPTSLAVSNVYSRLGSPAGASVSADVAALPAATVTAANNTGLSNVALSSTGVANVWAALTSGLSTSGSVGKKLADLSLGTDNKMLLSSDTGAGGIIEHLGKADYYIIKTDTGPFKLRLIKAGTGNADTGVVLLEQELRDVNGAAIRTMTTAFGQRKAP